MILMSKVIIQECKNYSVDDIMGKINSGIEKLGGWKRKRRIQWNLIC
jgi:hypothetical protein